MNNEAGQIRVLRPSAFRCIGLSVACAVMAVLLAYLWFKGTGDAWIPAAFMVAGSIFFAFHLVPNAYGLWLDAKGFNVSEMYTVKRYDWPVVSEFNVRRGILGYYVEFFHDTPETERPKRIVLNETYGFKPVEMARILNDQRRLAMAEKEKTSRRNVWPSHDS